LQTVHGCDSVVELTLLVGTPKAVIIATSGPGGIITPSGIIEITLGNSQCFHFTPNPGYKIASVIVDGENVPASVISGIYCFLDLQSSHTIHVNFVLDAITITATAGANGAITPAGVITIAEGKSQAFTFKPATGYKIAEVLVDNVNVPASVTSGMYTFTKVTESHTIHVTFESKTKGALDLEEEETAEAAPVVYSYANTVHIKITGNVETWHAASLPTVEIYDMMGRCIHRALLTDVETAIPLNVASGIYFVRLISPTETIISKKVSLTKF
jgi:hypothetical protein